MKFICPLIVVEDIQKSKSFYTDLLEQSIKFDFGENVTFEGDFAIHLESHYQALIGSHKIKKGGNAFELYFEFDDLASLEKKLISNSIDFVHHLREQPWRQHVIRFYDPDKHIIEVGETMNHLCIRLSNEGHGAGEINKITGLPLEIISNAVISD